MYYVKQMITSSVGGVCVYLHWPILILLSFPAQQRFAFRLFMYVCRYLMTQLSDSAHLFNKEESFCSTDL